jgi:type I restriction enzyme, S subunit
MNMMLEQFKTIFDRPEKVKKLRETILDLAVRGKLVEQDPNDEPASVLLERIREEKERLIREKKIKQEKTLELTNEKEEPFRLPDGWMWTRFANCVRNIKGVTYKKNVAISEYIDGYELILRGGNIDSKTGLLNFSDNIYIPKGIVKEEQYILNGDTLMVASSGTKSSIAKSTFIKNKIEDTSVGAFLYIVRPFESINSRYINIIVQKFRQDIIDTTAGTNISNVNKGVLDEFLTPVPPLEEQKRIVEKVDSLMAFCDKLEKALEKKVHYGELAAKSVFNAVGNVSTAEELEETLRFILLNFKDLSLGDNAVKELKNCILQLAVQGKLVPQDPNDEPSEVLLEKIREGKERLIKEKKIKKEKPLAEISEEEKNLVFNLPQNWRFDRVGNIFAIKSSKRVFEKDYVENGIPFFRSKEIGELECGKYIVSEKHISIGKYNKIKNENDMPKIGDLLVTSVGTIGNTWIVDEREFYYKDGNITQVCSNKNMNIKYVQYYIKSNFFINQVNGTVAGTAYNALTIMKFKNIIITIPPIEEQKRIVEKVDSLMKLCDQLEKKIQKQKDYSNRLIESILKSSF